MLIPVIAVQNMTLLSSFPGIVLDVGRGPALFADTAGTPCCQNQTYQIMMWSAAAGEVVLAATRTLAPQSGPDCQVNNGWIAYTDMQNGVLQVWSYAPDGTRRQVTIFGSQSVIESLSPSGAIVYKNSGQRYLSLPPYDIATPLGSAFGAVLWRDDHFVVLVGGPFFRCNSVVGDL